MKMKKRIQEKLEKAIKDIGANSAFQSDEKTIKFYEKIDMKTLNDYKNELIILNGNDFKTNEEFMEYMFDEKIDSAMKVISRIFIDGDTENGIGNLSIANGIKKLYGNNNVDMNDFTIKVYLYEASFTEDSNRSLYTFECEVRYSIIKNK